MEPEATVSAADSGAAALPNAARPGLPHVGAALADAVSHRTWGFRSWAWVTVTCAAIAAAVFAGVAAGQWRDFQNNAFDLAIFDQLLWNTTQGRPFDSTFVPYGQYLGQHFSPVLALFVPFYFVGAGALFLTITQGFVVASAAIPLYFAARRWLGKGSLAAAVAAAYLLNPYLHRAVSFDFHPETMIALPAFASAWAAAERRFTLAAVLGASVLLFKEDSPYVALALSALIAWSGGKREGLWLAGIAVSWLLVTNLVFMPLLRGGWGGDYVPRYDGLAPGATTVPELAVGLATHPWRLPIELTRSDVLWTMALFIAGSAPLMLVRPAWLLALAPGMALAVLSSHGPQHVLELHYAAQLVPLALIGAILGARTVRERLDTRLLGCLILVPALLGFLGLSPISPFQDRPDLPTEEHRAALREAVALVPPGEPVSAQSAIVPRLAHRHYLKEFPGGFEKADWVVIDRWGALSGISVDDGFWEKLELVRADFELVYQQLGVEVYHRRE